MKYATHALLGFVTTALSGCAAEFAILGSVQEQVDPDDIICEPFSGETSTDPAYGIAGRIHYLLDGQPQYTSVFDHLNHGHDVGKELFLSNVFVPTRSFATGFTTASGLTIKRSDGAALEEWFSLHLEAALTLDSRTPADAPGNYQLAVLSDDGAVVQTKSGSGSYTTLINNDGAHSTRMSCASQPIRLDPGTEVPIKIDYYQGPRTEIALALMWRPFPTRPQDVMDPHCGDTGGMLFWNWQTLPSTPQQAYNDLLASGWKPLRWKNFKVVNGRNKCVLAAQ